MKIGLGTAAIGRPEYINIRQESKSPFNLENFKKEGIKVLDHAYESGIRYYDTAPGYGLAEQLLIDWAEQKTDVEIATKWGYTYVADYDPNAIQHEIKEHNLEKLVEQWHTSKELLPQLSTYQIHSATFETGVLEDKNVLEKLFQLKQDHNIHIGITTTGENQLDVLKKALEVEMHGEQLFSVFQVTYNLLDQSLEEILKQVSSLGKRVVVKEAVANGRIFKNDNFPHYASIYKALETLSNKYEVGVDAVALRFVQDSIQPFSILSGGSISTHIDSNLSASSFTLNEQEVLQLKNLSIDPKNYWEERKKLGWE